MKTPLKLLASATLLAAIGMSASAQPAPPASAASAPQARGMMGRHDPARMQAWIERRQAELKARLKITPEQEPAWKAYTASMTPMAAASRPSREEFDKLGAVQRMEKMRALQAEHMSAMDQRLAATKTFYAALTPEQQKIFDTPQRRGRDAHHHPMMGAHGNSGGPMGGAMMNGPMGGPMGGPGAPAAGAPAK